MANSDVWINGERLGHRPNGSMSFRYELTGKLRFGSGSFNVLSVRCDSASQPASRWYPGAGIYRHVRLIVTDDVHVEEWGTYVTTPSVTDSVAKVKIQTEVVNQSSLAQPTSLAITLVSPDGNPVQTVLTSVKTIAAGATTAFEQEIEVPRPERWDLTHPALYKARVIVRKNGAAVDEDVVPFGIREFHFAPETGFWLNGKNMKVLGVCLHEDGGAFGAAIPVQVWERRLQQLRAIGVNAIRTAHNPPSPDFLALCDRMGFLVMGELFDCWTVGKNPYDYHLYFQEWYKRDTRDAVRRDRNHPSIILWSAGNEIHDTPKAELAHEILSSLVQIFHENDPSRPVTQALFRPNVSHDYDNGLADLLDVVGQNYREKEILAAHQQKPSRKIIGTENTHDLQQWVAMRDNPPYAGQFIWTGVDYLGEAGKWPAISREFGLLDRAGFPHAQGLERESWWSQAPVVHITRRVAPHVLAPTDPGYEPVPQKLPHETVFADWTPENLNAHDENVEVYSNAPEVELFLNGKSLGIQAIHGDASPRTWKVPFEAGALKAVARNQGKEVATEELRTAGKPDHLILSAERKSVGYSWDEVLYVTATVVDAQGVVVPAAKDLVKFEATGAGSIAAVDNGDIASHEPFQASQRSAYRGRCIAVLKANSPKGKIELTASAAGLTPASLSLEATEPKTSAK